MTINYPSQQTNETFIQDDTEPKILHHEKVKNTNSTSDKNIILTKGHVEREDKNVLFEIDGPKDMHSRLITSDNEFAIRCYLQELEEHDVDEDKSIEIINKLSDETGIKMNDLKNQSKKERAKHLVNTVKYLYEKYQVKRQLFYLKNGDWRNTNPNNKHVKIANNILDAEDKNTQACYKTAFLAVLALRSKSDISNDRISYCEGISLGKYGGIPNQHAWVEIDNKVIELTWPWSGPKPEKTTLYYGLNVEWEHVYNKMSERPTYASVFMSDEEYYSQPSVIRAIQESKS